MARLQDYPSVTPTSTDNLLVVQSTGQGLASVGSTLGAKMDKANPTGTGSLSIGRSGTTGSQSVAVGYNVEASGARAVALGHGATATADNGSFAEGYNTTASGVYGSHAEGRATTASGTNGSHAEGYESTASGSVSHAEGKGTTASGSYSHSENINTVASGDRSHCEGYQTEATRRSQHVFGEYNIKDTSGADGTAKGAYIEIVGKGSNDANRSNARTLDWSGNEMLAGNLTYNGNVSLSRLLNAYSFSSASALNINVGRYCSIIILGFAQSIGAVAILLTITGSSITSIINMVTGAAWSNSHLTFSLSNYVLTVTSDSTSVSNLTFIYGGN